MGDIIKELNMIDFLGMLFPGAILILLFGEEFGVWSSIIGVYASNELGSPVALIIWIVLLGGYAAGMLLHEIGDTIEKCLNCSKVFNPRYWASVTTGLHKLLSTSDVDCNTKMINTISFWRNTKVRCFMALLAPVPVWAVISVAFELRNWISFIIGMTLMVTCLVVEKKDDETFWLIKSNDGVFVSCSGDNRKRNLFDGFRSMSRNLFLLLVLLQGYFPHLRSERIRNWAGDYVSKELKGMLWGILVILLIRYAHYSYLRFKYCYEDFIMMAAKESEKKPSLYLCPMCKHCISKSNNPDG